MADARMAIEFTGTSKRGVDAMVQEDGSLAFTIVVPHPRAIRRRCIRSIKRIHHTFLYSLWPASPVVLFSTCVGTLALVLKTDSTAGIRNGYLAHILWDLSEYVPGVESHSVQVRVGYVTFIAAFFLFFGISYILRYALRLMFSWQGWLHRGASKKCCTKCWAVAIRILTGRDCFTGKALTYSYQLVLPSLPVPNLTSTVTQYVESVQPLLSDEDFQETERLATEFLTGIGPNLNRYLTLKAWVWSSNYVTEWWEKYVYLRGRSSLMINSNYYIMDFPNYVPTTRQIARAAGMTRLMCDFCRLLDMEKIEPMQARGIAPLCMKQYERMFATTRQPGRDSDKLYHRARARHVVVLCAGHWYRVDVVRVPSGNPVEAHELERQFVAIQADAQRLNRNMSTGLGGGNGSGSKHNNTGSPITRLMQSSGMRRSQSTPTELGEAMKSDKNAHGGMYERLASRQISALTALPRDMWAKAKEEHLSEGVNRISVREIERALFVVVLDQGKHATLSERGKSLLHGNGTNRWFDKSLQLIVYTDGHCGMNCEHSWADAPVSGHLWEYCLCHEVADSSIYGGDGHLRGYKHAKSDRSAIDGTQTTNEDVEISSSKTNRKKFLQPQRLRFELTSTASSVVRDAATSAHNAMADLDLHVFGYEVFGKREIKGFHVSPDAFLQMALQLAYYRDSNGSLALTYEASMMRLFKHGRTETVRSLTKESSAFVKAMYNADLENEKIRIKLQEILLIACTRHQKSYIDAMTGHGVDRHLFALYVVAMGMGEESPFLKVALSQSWRLSTSQTPYKQTDVWDILPPELAQHACSGGGFGPVADDGYGCSYLVAGEDQFYFHISSKKSSPVTSSPRFAQHLKTALTEMKSLFRA